MEDERARGTALNLMRMALALLDRAGETFAAARLSHAIDALTAADVGDAPAATFDPGCIAFVAPADPPGLDDWPS